MQTSIQITQLPPIDVDGLLIHPEDWNKSVAEKLAHQLDINELTPDHWLVINALRDYHAKLGVAPSMNSVCHQYKKDGLWVHNLFATCLNAWRVAGLPDPGEEAKSYLSDM